MATACVTTPHLVADLHEDEGERLYAYQDSLGFWTIGVGILIDARKGGGITREESDFMLANRIASKAAELCQKAPWVANLDAPRREGLVNMAFQLGVNGVLNFKNALVALRAGDYSAAADHFRDSAWARQTPERAERVIKQITTGKYR